MSMLVNVVVSSLDLKTIVDVINVTLSHILRGIVQLKTMKTNHRRRNPEFEGIWMAVTISVFIGIGSPGERVQRPPQPYGSSTAPTY